ncbi:recombinase-like helix-turn-helix domain-containing protein [Achromobacter kerstersii]|uniref:recombinase-like helix-turn-helix domain-containing protein n=1 Tax=Achromobacter kerstersii TaxID=1353890 RepID=UPI003D05C09E
MPSLPPSFNPHLKPWAPPGIEHAAGKGAIERPGATPNLIWQTRSHMPTAYEDALGDALEVAFEGGADTPADLVASLNAQALRAPDGEPWTEAGFLQEMRRLGA